MWRRPASLRERPRRLHGGVRRLRSRALRRGGPRGRAAGRGRAFRDPIFLSGAALARSVALLERYDLGGSPVDITGRAFQKVLGGAARAGMGQYFTPQPIVALCVALLAPTARERVIDPFCGSGHFLTAALDHVRAHAAEPDAVRRFASNGLHGLEKSDRMACIAMTDMRRRGRLVTCGPPSSPRPP